MGLIAGADGCKEGWLAVWGQEDGQLAGNVFSTPRALWEALRPDILAVDVPIGLTNGEVRLCDREARRLLGRRHACVFNPPIRPALDSPSHAEANARMKQLTGRGVPAQHFGIYALVRDWDELLRDEPEAAARCFEVHPELVFRRLNGGEPASSKHLLPGLIQRAALLETVGLVVADFPASLQRYTTDLPDALVAYWTASRIASGSAHSILDPIPCDDFGLQMTMWV